jgi:hypothetical protein
LVQVADIDLSDDSYLLNPFPGKKPDRQLTKSIATVGILHPPLLLAQENRKFIVLSGRQRIKILADTEDNTSLTALVIENGHSNQQLMYSTLLQHHLIGSSLSVIEQAVFFKKALTVLPPKDTLQFLSMMGYKRQKHILDELIALLTLTVPVQLSLHKGTLARKSGKKLLLFSPADQKIVVSWINELQLGGSKQQKLIEQVFELTRRLKVNAVDVLNRWLEKDKGKQYNGPQRATALLKWLQEQCRPQSFAREEEFSAFRRSLELPQGVRLDHTVSFEDERLTLSLDFGSEKEIKEKWPDIRTVLKKD